MPDGPAPCLFRQASSNDLEAIQALYRLASRTLGFFPEGAFIDHLTKSRIVVAELDGQVVGYSIYRIAKGRASIAHVCVSSDHQKKRIAQGLVQRVIERTRHTQHVEVKCRRDYGLHKLWESCGFHPEHEVSGRGHDAAPVAVWKFQQQASPSLFAAIPENERPLVVLDANAIFGIGEQKPEDCALLDPDLLEDFTYCYTKEILHEIDRQEDRQRRTWSHDLLRTFKELPDQRLDNHPLTEQLAAIIPGKTSDVRHLVLAHCGHATYFITRDERDIIKNRHAIEHATGLKIRRPSEFISEYLQNANEFDYEPVRLEGSDTTVSQLLPSEVNEISPLFVSHLHQERERPLREHLHELIASSKHDVTLWRHRGEPVALMARSTGREGCMDVPLLRFRTAHPLHSTLVHHALLDLPLKALKQGNRELVISDARLSDFISTAAQTYGYVLQEGNNLHVRSCRKGLTYRATPPDSPDDTAARQWPTIVCHPGESYYIIPIQPQWAGPLFDHEIRSRSLFASSSDLALNRQNAYYRSPKAPRITAPGKILWYISQNEPGVSQTIRAISTIDSVCEDDASTVFRALKKLGIYNWKDVAETQDEQGRIMGITFSNTLLLDIPIRRAEIMKQFTNYGIGWNNLVSPATISYPCFQALMEGRIHTN